MFWHVIGQGKWSAMNQDVTEDSGKGFIVFLKIQ